MMTMQQVDEAMQNVVNQIDAVKAGMGAEMTASEMAQLDALLVEGERLQAHRKELQVEAARTRVENRAEPLNLPSPATNWAPPTALNSTSTWSSTGPLVGGRGPVTGGTLASARSSTAGFHSFSDFLGKVRQHAVSGLLDQRLMNAVTSFGSEGVGPDGGFAVPAEWAAQISQVVMGEQSLVGRLRPIITGTNQVVLPVDETTPYGTSGIVAEWATEGGTLTERKPSLKQATVTLNKVAVLAHLSDEMMADAPAVHQHVMTKFAEAIAAKVNEALIAGNGLGKPLGFASAPGKITQAKSATGTTSLQAKDVLNMLSRLPNGGHAGAFWLCHNSVLPEIQALTFGTAAVPLYQPDFRQSPYGNLLGLPVVTSEFCQSVNAAAGDIYLISPQGYALALHSSGLQTAASIHFAFNQGLQSFRATMRIGGTPLAAAPISRKNGSLTLSHIIDLAVRS